MASLTRSPARPFDGQLGEQGAGDLVHGLAGPPAFSAHGLGEFFQAEGVDRVVEQAEVLTAG